MAQQSTIVDIPGIGEVEFPASMTPEEMHAKAAELYHQHQSTSSQVGEFLTSPLVPQIAEAAHAIAEKMNTNVPHMDDTSVWEARVRGFLVGATGAAGDVASAMTSPVNLAMTLAGFGPESKAVEAVPGLKGLLGLKPVQALQRAVAAAGSGGAVGMGATQVATGDTVEEKAMGLAQAAGGLAGLASDPIIPASVKATARGLGHGMIEASKRPGYVRGAAIGVMGAGGAYGHPGAGLAAGLPMMVMPPAMRFLGEKLEKLGETKAPGLEYHMPNTGAPTSTAPKASTPSIRYAGAEKPVPGVKPPPMVSDLDRAAAQEELDALNATEKAQVKETERQAKITRRGIIEQEMMEGGVVKHPPQYSESETVPGREGGTLTRRQSSGKPPAPKTSEIDTIKEQFGEQGPVFRAAEELNQPGSRRFMEKEYAANAPIARQILGDQVKPDAIEDLNALARKEAAGQAPAFKDPNLPAFRGETAKALERRLQSGGVSPSGTERRRALQLDPESIKAVGGPSQDAPNIFNPKGNVRIAPPNPAWAAGKATREAEATALRRQELERIVRGDVPVVSATAPAPHLGYDPARDIIPSTLADQQKQTFMRGVKRAGSEEGHINSARRSMSLDELAEDKALEEQGMSAYEREIHWREKRGR